MSKEPLEFLKHIADECEYLLSVNKDKSKDDFLDDETLKRAVVRSLESLVRQLRKSRLILRLSGIQYNGKVWQA